MLRQAASSPDIILIARDMNCTIPEVAALYLRIGNEIHFAQLRVLIEKSKSGGTIWERRHLHNLHEDLYNYQSDLVMAILKYAKKYDISTKQGFEDLLDRWKAAHSSILENIHHSIKEARLDESLDTNALCVVVRDLSLLCST